VRGIWIFCVLSHASCSHCALYLCLFASSSYLMILCDMYVLSFNLYHDMYVARLVCFHYILRQMSTLFCTHAYFMYFVYLMWACSHDHALTPKRQRWKLSTILKANLCILVDKDCIQHLNTSVSNRKTQFGSPLKTPKS